jgi:hypothetical protein
MTPIAIEVIVVVVGTVKVGRRWRRIVGFRCCGTGSEKRCLNGAL